MMPASRREDLIARLPAVRGRYEQGVALASLTWFRVGGPAEVLFRPEDEDDLAAFLQGRPADVPLTVIGVGSNLLVRDGGIAGVTIRLGRAFARVTIDGQRVQAGASAPDMAVALAAARAGLAGLEFLRGIPGTIGGGVRMNAGAFGSEFRDVLERARALDGQGRVHEVGVNALGLGYRRCAAPEDWIFTAAELRGQPAPRAEIDARMAEVAGQRTGSQPTGAATGGSTFKNPQGARAWELIDSAGCRGLRCGGAQVSEKHCNFLINSGDATAADLEMLGEEVRRRVADHCGVVLEWEIRRLGEHAGAGLQEAVP